MVDSFKLYENMFVHDPMPAEEKETQLTLESKLKPTEQLQEGCIYWGIYPYYTINPAQADKHPEFGGFYSGRYCVALKYKNRIYIFSTTHYDEDTYDRKTQYRLEHPSKEKFKKSVINFFDFSRRDQVKALSKAQGELSAKDLKECYKRISELENYFYASPVVTKSLIVSSLNLNVGNIKSSNNIKRMIGANEILKGVSLYSTIDFAISMVISANKNNEENKLVLLKLSYKNTEKLLLYTLIKFLNKNWMVSRFIIEYGKAKAEFWKHASNKVEKIIDLENNVLSLQYGYNPNTSTKWCKILSRKEKDWLIKAHMLNMEMVDVIEYIKPILDIPALNERLNAYKWAIVIDGKVKDENASYDGYKILSPDEIDKYKAGCCWDYTNYEYQFFKNNFKNIDVKCYYSQFSNGFEPVPTHTWLTYKLHDDDKIYSFESSWKEDKVQGIHAFNSTDDMLDFYVKHIKRVFDAPDSYVIYEYIPKSGIPSNEFMEYVYKSSKLVRKVGDHYEKYIVPIVNENNWEPLFDLWTLPDTKENYMPIYG